MAKHVCVCMVCMNAICANKWMDFPIGLPKLASLSAYGFILKILDDHYRSMRDDTGRCLYIKLRTVCTRWSLRNRLSYYHQFDGPFGTWFHFWKIFGEPCQMVWKSYSWSNTVGEYLHSYTKFRTIKVYTCTDLSTKRWTFTLSKFDEPFGVRFYFERFLRTDVS